MKEIVSKSRTVIALGGPKPLSGGKPTQDATWPLLRRMLTLAPPKRGAAHAENRRASRSREPFYRRADFVLDSASHQRPKDLAENVCAMIKEKL